MNYYTDVLKKYAVFTGRASRKEYWMFFFFSAIISIVLTLIGNLTGLPFLTSLYALVVLLPSLAVAARRLHDTGRSAWWLLLALIPFIGAFVLVIFAVLDSQTGSNAYGSNPKGDSYVSKKTNVWLIVILCIVALAIVMAGISAWGFLSIMKNSQQTTTSINVQQ